MLLGIIAHFPGRWDRRVCPASNLFWQIPTILFEVIDAGESRVDGKLVVAKLDHTADVNEETLDRCGHGA